MSKSETKNHIDESTAVLAALRDHEFGNDGAMKWQRVQPPIYWNAAKQEVIADRRLPDGTRQHMVCGSVPPGLVISNAMVIGEADVLHAEFSGVISPLGHDFRER